ncbi:orf; Unknown function [Klebsiella pneumoniae ISC21]|nr:orf; Unknown function [Klebsiella pneumoniae ISC21]
MTVHDRTRLIGQFHLLRKNPAPAGFCYSNSGERMNDCPRRYTKRTRLIGQFHLFMSKPRFGGVFAI